MKVQNAQKELQLQDQLSLFMVFKQCDWFSLAATHMLLKALLQMSNFEKLKKGFLEYLNTLES